MIALAETATKSSSSSSKNDANKPKPLPASSSSSSTTTVTKMNDTNSKANNEKKIKIVHALPDPSKEQEAILNRVSLDFDVAIQANAGAAKSTTLLMTAHRFPDKNFVLMTYNKKLQVDVQEKIQLYKLHNVKAFTYHGAASTFFSTLVHDDQIMIDCLRRYFKAKNFGFNPTIANKFINQDTELVPTGLGAGFIGMAKPTGMVKPVGPIGPIGPVGPPGGPPMLIVKSNQGSNTKRSKAIDVLMLDETQDLTVSYYKFVCYFIDAATINCQLLLCGDVRQSINNYKGSRVEFLTSAPELYGTKTAIDNSVENAITNSTPPAPATTTPAAKPQPTTMTAPSTSSTIASTTTINDKIAKVRDRKWAFATLTTSYRLTPSNANFVNQHVLNTPNFMIGGNTKNPNVPDLRPTYLITSFSTAAQSIGTELFRCLSKYGPQGVVLLVPSVKNLKTNKGPLGKLVNEYLCNVKLHIASRDDESVDEKQLLGKLLITTPNSMKGCERDCVFLMPFDESYFQFYERNWLYDDKLPNIMYVATTRAIREMIVIADEKLPIRTLNFKTLLADCTVKKWDRKARTNIQLTRLPQPMIDNAFATKINNRLQEGDGDEEALSSGSNKGRGLKSKKRKFKDDFDDYEPSDDDDSDNSKDNNGKNLKDENEMTIAITDLFSHMDPEIIYQMKQLFTVESVAPTSLAAERDTSILSTNMLVSFDKTDPKDRKDRKDRKDLKDLKDSKSLSNKPPAAGVENVSELYSLLIPAMAEFKKTGSSMFGVCVTYSDAKRFKYASKQVINSYPEQFWPLAKQAYSVNPKKRTIEQWMRLAIATNAIFNGRHHIARQVAHYQWIDPTFIDNGSARVVDALLNQRGEFHVDNRIVLPFETLNKVKTTVDIYGSVDFVDYKKTHVRQFKCTTVVKDETLLQLACFCIMFKVPHGFLHTVLDNKTYKVSITAENGAKLLKLALGKFVKQEKTIQELISDFEAMIDPSRVLTQTTLAQQQAVPSLNSEPRPMFLGFKRPTASNTSVATPNKISDAKPKTETEKEVRVEKKTKLFKF